MHHSYLIPLLISFLTSHQTEARPAPQADAAPCPTTILLPEATLTAVPGPSNAVISGLPDGSTATIEVNGPAITIGSSVLLLNDQLNLVLDGNPYEFSGVCPATLTPVIIPSAGEGGEPGSSPTAVIPIVIGPTDTPPADTPPADTPPADDPPADTPPAPIVPIIPTVPEVPVVPVVPDAPVVTPPPTPPVADPTDPNNDDPEECNTITASVCTQGCSFGVNDLGVTTTSSCKDPTCTATAGCSITDTTSTTTIEPPTCSLANNGVDAQYPFEIDGDGPLPILQNPVAGAPAPADPKPTDPPEPTQPEPEQPSPPVEAVNPPTQTYEVGAYTNSDGKGIWAIFRHDKGSSVNVCGSAADKPMFEGPDLPAPEVLLDLKDAVTLGPFDLPDSYPACNFVANDPKQGGDILCNAQPKVACTRMAQNAISFCAVGSAGFQALWVCNG
ncbi:hypothetical protein EJ02DRAFT_472917 [Clathrospora elynae]|uniref:Uncharacterized protein n=1 Tax=Clathrospora elynae TaxID=706981 RepID=A0A6A5SJQ5_9PLEO|nr:hypothetical protein EJ02DRAFT_472917 [Clathrospora elynae]